MDPRLWLVPLQAMAQAMSGPEIVGTVFGLVCVALTVRANIWCWPTGLVSVVAYAILFFRIQLYADALLQIFFFATSIYGWWFWLHGGENRHEAKVTRLTDRGRILTGLAMLVASFVTGWLFSSFTDAHVPYLDSLIAGMSVTAQVLLMRKKFENWALWIVVDVLSVGLYLYKQVYLTAALYAVFLILATRGFNEWQKLLELDSRPVSNTGSSSESSSPRTTATSS